MCHRALRERANGLTPKMVTRRHLHPYTQAHGLQLTIAVRQVNPTAYVEFPQVVRDIGLLVLHTCLINSAKDSRHAVLLVDFGLCEREKQDIVLLEALRHLEAEDRTLTAALLVCPPRSP